jgi:hypothetical protein
LGWRFECLHRSITQNKGIFSLLRTQERVFLRSWVYSDFDNTVCGQAFIDGRSLNGAGCSARGWADIDLGLDKLSFPKVLHPVFVAVKKTMDNQGTP